MEIVTELDLPVFDYTAPDLTGEVYHERLAEVRRQGWLARSPLSCVVLDRESGEFFLRSRATVFPGRQIAQMFGVTSGKLWEQIDANILNQTGDRHRRLRALVGPAFTPRAADRWRPVMRGFLARLWEDIAPATACEFVAAVAKPYPSLTIAAVLGAPLEDAPRLHERSHWVQRQFDIRALADELPRLERAVEEVYAYVEELLERRRADPSDDLLSTLLSAEADGERLSHAECVNLVVNVLAGGVDTAQSQLAHALRLFAEHPDQWTLLAQRPDLVPRAVQEVLRFEPITPFTARLCTEQVEYRGVIFPAGTIVAVCAERGNREEDDGERRHHGGARRAAADLRRGPPLLPRGQPRHRGAGGSTGVPGSAPARSRSRRTPAARRRGGHLRNRAASVAVVRSGPRRGRSSRSLISRQARCGLRGAAARATLPPGSATPLRSARAANAGSRRRPGTGTS